MHTDVFLNARWITTEDFSRLKPVNVFEKQLEKSAIETDDGLVNYHAKMFTDFVVENAGRASINISADDYYKLYINGQFVGQGPAQGYWFSYYWNTFDITDYLVQGKNEISVCVYYCGLLNRAFNSADNRMGLIAEIIADGECILSTDSSWNYCVEGRRRSNNVLGASTLFTEDIDNRIADGISKKCVAVEADYTFNKNAVTPIRVYKKAPETVKKLNTNYYLYDFGTEVCASVSVKAFGQSGNRLKILLGEELDANGFVRYDMRCNCKCENICTLADGENLFDLYDYVGFRYLGIETDVEITEVFANVRHFPFDDDYCILETDNEDLQKVWKLCKNTLKYATQEAFMDCPQREKGQYAGDLTITSGSYLVLTGNAELLKKAIDNQMQSSRFVPSLLAVTPGSYVQEIADYSFQFPILALRYYAFSKDKEYLKSNLKVCEKIIAAFRKYAREDGLLQNVDDKWNLVDWPHNLRDGYDFPLDPLGEAPHNVLNAFYIGCVLQTEQIRKILGIDAPIESEKLIKSFNAAFYDAERKVYTDCEATSHTALHSNILPAFYGFNPKGSNEAITRLICEKGMCCGVYVAYFMLKALCRLGAYSEALDFILSEGENSWLNMIAEGATTCFEAWGKDQKWNTSLCHPWATAPILILAEDILPNNSQVGRIKYDTFCKL